MLIELKQKHALRGKEGFNDNVASKREYKERHTNYMS